PAARFAQLTGPRRALDDALTHLDLPTGASVLGPMPVTVSKAGQAGQASQASHSDRRADSGPDWHVFIRIASDRTLELTRALSSLRAVRSARKANEVVTVRVDPHENW
ncbi:MAG: primosome assembly protein PriA, partial [Terracoccus sp.]